MDGKDSKHTQYIASIVVAGKTEPRYHVGLLRRDVIPHNTGSVHYHGETDDPHSGSIFIANPTTSIAKLKKSSIPLKIVRIRVLYKNDIP